MMNWISIISVGGIIFLSWLNGMKIISLHCFMLFVFIFLLYSTISSSSPSQTEKSNSSEKLPTSDSQSNIKKQKLQYLDYLIEKNNNFHKKYKIKNSIVNYVKEFWQMDLVVSEEIAKFIQLILRDFIDPWYKYVSTNDEFILCTEEFLANTFSILISRGRIGLNPVVFFGEKVCYSLQLTLTKLREISTVVKERPEFVGINPSMTREWELYQMSIAEEFRSGGNLHPAFQWDDQEQSSDNLTMEEFFSKERLQKCERNYSKYIGTKLLKQLMTSPEDYNCRTVRYLAIELVSNTILASILSLITPLNINIWIDMGIKYLPSFSESVLTPSEDGVTCNSEEEEEEALSLSSQAAPHQSSDHLHLEFSAHFVGSIGLETVSSSCCVSTQEAAAAIVFREGCQLTAEDEADLSPIQTIDYSHDVGKFIVRKCEFNPFGSGVFCISYIRPSSSPSPPSAQLKSEQKDDDLSHQTAEWIVFDDGIHAHGNSQAKVLRTIFEDSKHLNVPLTLSDSVVGHIFVYAQSMTSTPGGSIDSPIRCQYNLLGCSHAVDIESLITNTSEIQWTNFEEMICDLLPNLDKIKTNKTESVRPRTTSRDSGGESGESGGDALSRKSNEPSATPLEESFLREQRKLFHFFELTGAIDEFLHGDVPKDELDNTGTLLSSIKLLPSDLTKMKSFRRVIGALRDVIIDGMNQNWMEKATSSTGSDVPFTNLLDNISTLYSRSMRSFSNENITTPPDDLNLIIWTSFVISRCQMTPKDWNNSTTNSSSSPTARHSSTDSDGPCCLLCGDRKCYLLADSTVRNYPLNREENKFIRDLKLDILTDQLEVNGPISQYDFLVYILYVSGAYGLLYSVVNILSVLLNPMKMTSHSSSFHEIITQKLNPPNHWIYFIQQQCWAVGAIMKSPTESGQVLDLLSPLDRVSIFISPACDPLIQTPKSSQKIGISNFVGSKIEKALAAATRVFADSSSEDDHETQAQSQAQAQAQALPPPSPQFSQSNSSERERSESRDEQNLESSSRVSFLTESGRSLSNKGQMIMASLTSLEDSLTSTASNLTVTAPPPPYLTFTSSNTDIIEIFRMRKQTADDKWEQKNSGSIKSTARIEVRRAEATFKISILLRDRPTPMFLESRRMILPREDLSPPNYWVEINKSERLTQNWMLYTITIFKTMAGVCPRHNNAYSKQKFELFSLMHTKEEGNHGPPEATNSQATQQQPVCICHCWEVKRRYSDFDDFHKHLKTQIGLEILQKLRLPAKNFLKVVQSQQFIEKRMKGLQDYLRAVLTAIPGSFELDIFLEEQDHMSNSLSSPPPEYHSTTSNSLQTISEEDESKAGGATAGAAAATPNESSSESNKDSSSSSSSSSNRPSKLFRIVNSVYMMQKVTTTLHDSADSAKGGNAPSSAPVSTSSTAAGSQSSTLQQPLSSSVLDSKTGPHHPPEDILKGENDKIDSSKFPVIEERMFALINELLEVDDMTVMKKKIVSLAMRSIRLLFRTSMTNWMQHQSKVLSPDTQAGYFLKWVRELVWPNDVFYVTPPSYVPPDFATIRKLNIDHLVSFIPSTLNTYIGENQDIKLLEKIYTLLDNPYILKSLVYMLIDSVLIDIFPEFAEKLSGIDALHH